MDLDCHGYSKLMSQKLDGTLDEAHDKDVEAHVAGCQACATLWAAMLEADVLMWKWVQEPLPVPDNFGSKVMVKIGAQREAVRAPSYDWTPQTSNVTRPLDISMLSKPGPLTMQMQDWQRSASRYVKGVAIGVLSVAGVMGLLLTLLVTGVIQFGGPLAGVTASLRTYLSAIDTWARSLFVGLGAGVYVVAGVIMLLLAVIAWQLIAQYQRSASQVRGNTGYLEAVT